MLFPSKLILLITTMHVFNQNTHELIQIKCVRLMTLIQDELCFKTTMACRSFILQEKGQLETLDMQDSMTIEEKHDNRGKGTAYVFPMYVIN